MLENLITGMMYVQFDDKIGTNPLIWKPSYLSEQIRILVGIKSVSMLTGEQSYIPKKSLIIPFPSQNLKGLIKFLQWKDESRRGGEATSVIAILFEEINDVIFYKYQSYLETTFNNAVQNFIELEKKIANLEYFNKEMANLETNILSILDDLRINEEFKSKPQAFPDIEIGKDIVIDYKFKIIVCGDPEVGKTSTVLRFTDNAFTTNYLPTLGVNISERFIKFNENLVDLVLWDVAGQQKFDRMRKHFYQGLDGILLIFDLTRPDSFTSIENWYKDIMKNVETEYEIVGFILGNKQDLVEERKLDKEKALLLKEKLNLDYYEISALTGHNVNKVFYQLTHEIIKTIDS